MTEDQLMKQRIAYAIIESYGQFAGDIELLVDPFETAKAVLNEVTALSLESSADDMDIPADQKAMLRDMATKVRAEGCAQNKLTPC